MKSVASPHLERVLAEQDRETLRRLSHLRNHAEGRLDEEEIDRTIENILKRLERTQ